MSAYAEGRYSLRRQAGGYAWVARGPLNAEIGEGFARTKGEAIRAAQQAIDADIYQRAERERANHHAKYGPASWLDGDHQ